MKTKFLFGIACLTIFSLFDGQALAADWKFFYSSGNGDMYYDKSSIKKINKNVVRVSTKKIYNEKGKLEQFSLLKEKGKSPGNPYILSHELISFDVDCANKKIKISSRRICDKRGDIVVSASRLQGEWDNIIRKSGDEELKNIVCCTDKTCKTK